MRREIGSEFWEIPTGGNNSIFPNSTKWFLSGRVALQAIIKENNFKVVALPDWCCDSMIKPFIKAGMEIVFYHALDGLNESVVADAALVMDYFGYTGHSSLNGFKGIVIRDVTHSVFSHGPIDADYCFGSLRKWAGFWTGGFAWGFKESVDYCQDVSEYVSLRQNAMLKKNKYIKGITSDKSYLQYYSDAEEKLEDVGILSASQRDVELALKLDVDYIVRQRRTNAEVLLNAFSDIAIFPDYSNNDCPMFVPIRIKNRDKLRKYLIDRKIYCPVHWPESSYHKLSEETRKLYNEELSLICDQRYNEADMLRIVQAVKEYLEEKR